ncbi:aldo/keto reductase [Lacticaseibacillus saniviri]|uniref:Oxidoreductase n=1 Tax=Lacticaseibacillus saniviri JCM 17471 = DSM 24301 TaxID=1293598 RepID=A0A0R2N511_9LACO|nr:aldo/keto reductase [Lacticaseibacillus saniviri]KRO18883.1 oxidoreductase [Lacticaseibacillus saniviri JCM 17471 = DSM 24301]
MAQFNLDSKYVLNNGVEMPRLGLGVWKTDNKTAETSVTQAIKDGYTLIDTAKQYGNETGVGRGIAAGLEATGKKREDLFITTKVFNGDQGFDSTLQKFEGTLKRLGLDYIDLYLIHWPVDDTFVATWQALETLYKAGRVRAIGVSNFDETHLQQILDAGTVVPAVDQIEFNPLVQDTKIREFAKKYDIAIEAWSPLGGGASLTNPAIQAIADAHHKTTAQVILRFDLQSDIITIPKSVHEARIIENADVYDFQLSQAEMKQIEDLNKEQRSLWLDDFYWHGNPKGYKDEVDQWPDSPEDYDA